MKTGVICPKITLTIVLNGHDRVREHAKMMGMALPEDDNFLWIAEESLLAPLPPGFRSSTM